MVMNRQKDRYRPCRKGQIKPMANAANVGITKTGQKRLIAFSIFSLPPMGRLGFRRRGGQIANGVGGFAHPVLPYAVGNRVYRGDQAPSIAYSEAQLSTKADTTPSQSPVPAA